MQWRRLPSPGKMTGGNRWEAQSGATHYTIAKAHGKFYLTAAVGFDAKPFPIGVFDSLASAKQGASPSQETNPMKKRGRKRKSHTGARTKAKRITAQIRKLKAQRKKLYR